MRITGYKGTGGAVVIPGTIEGRNVTSIGDGAFAGCTNLNSVTIPSSVTTIGDWAFNYCTSLSNITVDPYNNSYKSSNGVLFTKDEKTLVCYPAGKTGASYSIPNSVTTISRGAFADCTSLNTITIPNSVTTIGDAAFAYCTSLSNITVDPYNNSYKSSNGVLFSNDDKTLICYPAGKTGASYTIPNGVATIGAGAFACCTNLNSVTIPNSVNSIGDWAFAFCTSLNSITIPSSVTTIGDGAFEYCTSLNTITIPNSVTTIGTSAFYGCNSLNTVTIQGSTTSIGTNAFYGCSSTLTIRCYSGSKAQTYCEVNYINYQLIGLSVLPSVSAIITTGPGLTNFLTSSTPTPSLTSIPIFRPISPIPIFP